MLTLKHRLSTILAISIVGLLIGIMISADNTPGPFTVETSDGTIFTINDRDRAHQEWNTHENYLRDDRMNMSDLIYEKDILQKGVSGDRSGLDDAIQGVGITVIAGKRPDLAALAALARKVLDMINEGKRFDIYLDFISKWAEIESKNQDIANSFSDRDKFWSVLAEFEGFERKKQNEGDLSSMQTSIPPIGVRCGGACNDWWYNDSWWYENVLLAGKDYMSPVTDPFTGVVGTRASTSELSSLATSHKDICDGCSDEYWICKTLDVWKHEPLYCGKSITWYTYDSLSGKWGRYSLGICGASYRRCDDPKKTAVHHYRPIMQGGQDSWGNWGYYISSYRGDTPDAHGKGSKSATASINGPNGSGISPDRMDKSPNCDSCMDGSRFCPDASTGH